jgi:hypothetical protein
MNKNGKMEQNSKITGMSKNFSIIILNVNNLNSKI